MIACIQTKMAPSALLIVEAIFGCFWDFFCWQLHCTSKTAQHTSCNIGNFQDLRMARSLSSVETTFFLNRFSLNMFKTVFNAD